MVTPRDGHLVLLGRLTGDLERPDSLQELLSRRGQMDWRDPLALTAVAGWLVAGGIHSCSALGPDATPCPGPGPLLTDREPSPDGLMASDVQQQVRVWPDAVGIDTAQVVTAGPFLYRIAVNSPCPSTAVSCARAQAWLWEVVARYDASTVSRVVVP